MQITFAQSNQFKYNDFETAVPLDDLKYEDFLFMKGYKLQGKGKALFFENGLVSVYHKGKTIDDYSSITRTKYKNRIYSINYKTYSEAEFENFRKSVILLGYQRTPDEGNIICYESKSLSIGFASTKDKDGDLRYSIHVSDKLINPYNDIVRPKK